MTFQLDTSGAVEMTVWDSYPVPPKLRWSDLTPFAQGYIEGLFADPASFPGPWRHGMATLPNGDGQFVGFSDLHPEALALILRDCEAVLKSFSGVRLKASHGAEFWWSRQKGFRVGLDAFHGSTLAAAFPPLHPFLSDDGRVCLRPASETQSGEA